MNAIAPVRAGVGSVRLAEGEPPALAAFIHDEPTRAALAAALGMDWPNAHIALGDIDDAIGHLSEDASPRYLVVDLSEIREPLAALDRLAEVCAPGTFLVALGEVNDVGFYRALRTAGVADYLVKPVTSEALGAALHAGRRRNAQPEPGHPAAPAGQVFVVVGARGGAGATTVATTLAWLLAHDANQRTMLVDLDLHAGATALALDVEPGRGLSEALENPGRIDTLFVSSAAATIDKNLRLLSSEEPFDTPVAVRSGALATLVTELKREFARVVVDLPRTDLDMLRQGLGLATTVVVVTDLSLAGLRDASRLIGLTKGLAPDTKLLLVGNRVGSAKKAEIPRTEAEKATNTPFAALIPEDNAAVPRALNTGRPLAVSAPGSKATAALRALARTLDETKQGHRPGLLARLLGGAKG